MTELEIRNIPQSTDCSERSKCLNVGFIRHLRVKQYATHELTTTNESVLYEIHDSFKWIVRDRFN